MPNRPWVMTQSWHELFFAHWRTVDPAEILRAEYYFDSLGLPRLIDGAVAQLTRTAE